MLKYVTKVKNIINARMYKYILTGISSLAVDYVLFATSYYIFQSPLKISVPLGLTGGLVFGFFVNRHWTFKTQHKKDHHTITIQAILYLVLFIFNTVFSYYFINLLINAGTPAMLGKILSTACITFWNYYIYKTAIFRARKGDSITY